MRDWASHKTAAWWQEADAKYADRNENLPSEEYFDKFFTFDSVLDVGSGTGRLINQLPAKHKAALDINKDLLKLVNDDVKKYNYDITDPIFINGNFEKYDLVFTFQVLQHLDHDNFLKALGNIKRFAAQEIWLFEGQVPGVKDGASTSPTGSWHHQYQKYLKCYAIDGLHGGKIKVFKAKI